MSNNAQPAQSSRIWSDPFGGGPVRTFSDYLWIIRTYWIPGTALALLATILISHHLLNKPSLFETEASILIERQERVLDMPRVVDTGIEGAGGMIQAMLQNHIEQLSSRQFSRYVLNSLTDRERESILAPYREEDPEAPPPSIEELVRNGLRAESSQNSFKIRLRMQHRDPEVAAMLANRYLDQYIRYNMDRSMMGNRTAISFLEQQAEELRQKVADSEIALQEYREAHNLVSVEENTALLTGSMREINARLTQARIERIDLESRLRQLETRKTDIEGLIENSEILSFGPIEELFRDLNRTRQQRGILSDRYGPMHPRMIENEKAIQTIEDLISRNAEMALNELRNRLQTAMERERGLERELRNVEDESRRLGQLAIEYQVLRRATETSRQTHTQILSRLNETIITSQLDSSNIRIVDYGEVPTQPIEPNPQRALAVSVFVGGLIFIGVPLVIDNLNSRLRSPREVEQVLNQRQLGTIPRLRRIRSTERPHIVARNLSPKIVEVFQSLQYGIDLASNQGPKHCLLVVSTLPGEGTTTIAINLANSYATSKKRTLLIDGDFRSPRLSGVFGLRQDQGIVPWLGAQNKDLDLSGNPLSDPTLGIHQHSENLSILPCGKPTLPVAGILGDARLPLLIRKLKEDFEVLIIDGPPVGIHPDALSLTGLADEIVFNCRVGRCPRQSARQALDRLRETRAQVLGVVLNDVPPRFLR